MPALRHRRKDRDLPDTVPPGSTELRLTDDWQVYEIDLAMFAKTELGHLVTPLGIQLQAGAAVLFIQECALCPG